MKAVVIDKFGGPEEMYYTDVEKPVPQPDEVLVKNVYIGVGKPDYIMRSGICPFLEKKPLMAQPDGILTLPSKYFSGMSFMVKRFLFGLKYKKKASQKNATPLSSIKY